MNVFFIKAVLIALLFYLGQPTVPSQTKNYELRLEIVDSEGQKFYGHDLLPVQRRSGGIPAIPWNLHLLLFLSPSQGWLEVLILKWWKRFFRMGRFGREWPINTPRELQLEEGTPFSVHNIAIPLMEGTNYLEWFIDYAPPFFCRLTVQAVVTNCYGWDDSANLYGEFKLPYGRRLTLPKVNRLNYFSATYRLNGHYNPTTHWFSIELLGADDDGFSELLFYVLDQISIF